MRTPTLPRSLRDEISTTFNCVTFKNLCVYDIGIQIPVCVEQKFSEPFFVVNKCDDLQYAAVFVMPKMLDAEPKFEKLDKH